MRRLSPSSSGPEEMGLQPAIDRRAATRQGEGPFFIGPRGLRSVAKPELGTKRLCAGCGAKFYDLGKTPPVCPTCGTVFEIVAPVTRGRPDARAAAVRTAEPEAAETPEVETISLEDADAEAQGTKKKAVASDADAADDVDTDDVDAGDDDGDEDDTFIEENEDEDTDVTEIIGGDIEDEEES
jgi:uncharacterized protein (TIGR02300 family)